MKDEHPTVIRIVKKKHVEGGHHGGSWKVAYADFVTALMAFFLVMWILGMDQTLKEEIEAYFNDPFSASVSITGISKLATGGKNPLATGATGIGAKNWRELALEAQRTKFQRAEQSLKNQIAGRPDLSRLGQQVKIEVGQSGLIVELIETEDTMFFESGSAALPQTTRDLLSLIARELGGLANPVVVEGHTDVVPYRGTTDYTNWELSTDRANAARRVMEAAGLRPGQVVEVRGYGSAKLRDPAHPRASANRRVSILVNYSPAPAEAGESEGAGPLSGGPFDIGIKPE